MYGRDGRNVWVIFVPGPEPDLWYTFDDDGGPLGGLRDCKTETVRSSGFCGIEVHEFNAW